MAVSKNTHPPTPRANPKKKTRSKPDSEPDMEPDAPLLPIPPDSSVHFPEVIGKTVALLYYVNDAPGDWQSLEVCFTDGTYFSFELTPRVDARVFYEQIHSGGDEEVIRDYGIIPGNAPENGDG